MDAWMLDVDIAIKVAMSDLVRCQLIMTGIITIIIFVSGFTSLDHITHCCFDRALISCGKSMNQPRHNTRKYACIEF